MFFHEFARLVEAEPDLAEAVNRVDRHLGALEDAERAAIEIGQLAMFTGLATRRVAAIVEWAVAQGVLAPRHVLRCGEDTISAPRPLPILPGVYYCDVCGIEHSFDERSLVRRYQLLKEGNTMPATIDAKRFPEVVDDFFSREDAASWTALGQDAKTVLRALAVKFEPLVRVLPLSTDDLGVLGFELLCLGPNGQAFPAMETWCAENAVPPDLFRIALLIVALKSAKTMDSRAFDQGVVATRNLVYTVNLDDEMLKSPLLGAALRMFPDFADSERVKFEVNEALAADLIDAVKRARHDHGLHLALDDSNALKKSLRVRVVADADLVKIDRGFFQEVMSYRHVNPTQAIDDLASLAVRGKPFVIEGIEKLDEIGFLQRTWDHPRVENVYGQGWALQDAGRWNHFLKPRKDQGLKAGLVLPSRLDE